MGAVAIFGDSIANGLGVRKLTYAQIIAQALGKDLLDFTGTAQTVAGSLDLLKSSDAVPEIAIVAHGITEAVMRPLPEHLRWLPARWRRTGWMDPRPYYSSKLHRRIFERVESEVRWRTKNFVMTVGGAFQFLTAEEYEDLIRELVLELHRRGCHVILLGTPDIAEDYFPGSQRQQELYELRLTGLDAQYIPLGGRLDRWDDYLADRFHPNDVGHFKISQIVLEAMTTQR